MPIELCSKWSVFPLTPQQPEIWARCSLEASVKQMFERNRWSQLLLLRSCYSTSLRFSWTIWMFLWLHWLAPAYNIIQNTDTLQPQSVLWNTDPLNWGRKKLVPCRGSQRAHYLSGCSSTTHRKTLWGTSAELLLQTVGFFLTLLNQILSASSTKSGAAVGLESAV